MTVGLIAAANWPIIGQISWLLGKVMGYIYQFLDNALPTDNGLVGLSIILYTIFVYTLMLPMTINQQKNTKMQAVIQPEVKEIQKKYKNKTDQASQMKMQEEMRQVYDKYGTSMAAGCLPMLIQMPLLFALYPVIYKISDYIPNISTEANKFLTIPDMSMSPSAMFSAVRSGKDLGFPTAVIMATVVILPVFSAATQFISNKLLMRASSQTIDPDNPMAGTMKTMNLTMPLFSLFMVFTLPSGIGVYWVVSAIVRCVQQLFINKHLSDISTDDLIEKNREKAARKQEKRKAKNERIAEMAQMNTKKMSNISGRNLSDINSEADNESKPAVSTTNSKFKPGGIGDKANSVKRYNENK